MEEPRSATPKRKVLMSHVSCLPGGGCGVGGGGGSEVGVEAAWPGLAWRRVQGCVGGCDVAGGGGAACRRLGVIRVGLGDCWWEGC